MSRQKQTPQDDSEHLTATPVQTGSHPWSGRIHQVPLHSASSLPRYLPRTLLQKTTCGTTPNDEEACVDDTSSATVASKLTQRFSSPSAGPHRQSDTKRPEKFNTITNNETRKFLDKIHAATPCVFICVGPPQCSRIIPISVKDDASDEDTFKAMKESWCEHRKWILFRKVIRVEEVTFRFAGETKVEKRTEDHILIGIYEPVDIAQLRQNLQNHSEAILESIRTWKGPIGHEECSLDYTSGKWEHSLRCASHRIDSEDCDIEKFECVQDHLDDLSLIPALTLSFCNPSLAKGQRLLGGLALREDGVYSHLNMLRNLYRYDPRIGNITFKGYSITEGWDDARCSAALTITIISIIGSTAIFRAIFGDWQTTMAASSLEVAAVTLIIQWMVYAAKQD